MKKIAFVSTLGGHAWGGSEDLWSQSAIRLAGKGIRVSANVQWWPEPVKQIEEVARVGCQVERRPPPRPARRLSRIGHRLRYGSAERRLRWLDSLRPDLVVISQAAHYQGFDWMQACAERKLPYAPVAEVVGEYWWPNDDQVSQFAPCLEQAAACFFVSKGNLELARTQFATPLVKAKVIRNPFNVAYDVAPPWPDREGPYKLACVGRLEPFAKGQDILFDVLRGEKWRRRPVQVTLFGGGENSASLETLRRIYELDNVTLGGFVPDVASIWATHHALVLPSRFEGLPLVVVEAMLCGRVCIVTDVGGNAELMEDNVSGFVAAAPKSQCLDEAMERAWEKRCEWRDMGRVAARDVRRSVPRDPVGAFVDQLLGLLA